jgi:hypothetical protein
MSDAARENGHDRHPHEYRERVREVANEEPPNLFDGREKRFHGEPPDAIG